MQRTKTTELTSFDIPAPNEATLNFKPADINAISIRVPQGSQWRMPLHWHARNDPGCISVRCLDGHIRIFRANERTGGYVFRDAKDSAIIFKPDESTTWCCSRRQDRKTSLEDWGVELVVTDSNLYRNTCSAILDRDIYPQLSSTPLWVKILFRLSCALPRAREALGSLMLWIQLQSVLYHYNFREYHGRINLTWPWTAQPVGGAVPPAWVLKLQLQVQHLISNVVMASCFWLGRLLLGMKGSYPEYTRVAQPWAPRGQDSVIDEKIAKE